MKVSKMAGELEQLKEQAVEEGASRLKFETLPTEEEDSEPADIELEDENSVENLI